MKILVNDIPKEPKDCLFCKYSEHRDDNYYHGYISKQAICKITDNCCALVNMDSCPFLDYQKMSNSCYCGLDRIKA